MLLSSSDGGDEALTVAVSSPQWGTVSEGFGSAAASTAASSGADSPRSGFKRPRATGSSWEGNVVRLKSPRGMMMPVVSPPELMLRKGGGAAGSLVRQIACGAAAAAAAAGGGDEIFRPSPRIRKAASSSASSGGGDGGGGGGGGDVEVTVMECSALEDDFQGLPAPRYTLVTVTRGGKEAWRDYVAGMATACCGNDRMVAVGAEDGSVYVYDR